MKMEMEEFEYINGSIVAAPKEENRRKLEEEKRKREEEERKRRKRLHEISKYNRKCATQIILISLVLGIITVALSSNNYSMQKKLHAINSQIDNVTEINEDLQIQLLKYSSLQDIENNAIELGMRIATKEDIVTLDLSKNYFQELEDSANKQEEPKKGFFSKLMDVLM